MNESVRSPGRDPARPLEARPLEAGPFDAGPFEAGPLDRDTAATYATWFRALADATRIQIVSLLARRGAPMSVGEIVAAVDVGQSTVSAHLKTLADVGFLLADRRGTAVFYRINDACVNCFPTAADIVMGQPVPELAQRSSASSRG